MDNHIEDFIKYLKLIRNYSNYTIDAYVHDIYEYQEYLDKHRIPYKKIKYESIAEYIKTLKLMDMNASSINRHLSSLRSFYNYLVKEEVIDANPFNLVKSQKKPIRLPNYMKYNEFETMLSTCDNTPLGIRNRALLELLLATGARISEVLTIRLKSLDLNNNEVRVLGKGNKERICYFKEHCREAIINYLNDSRSILLGKHESDYLFLNNLGTPLTPQGVRHIINKIIIKSGVETQVSPHTFRHTFATMLLNEGCDLKSVQELLGHASLSTTSIYTHLTNDRMRDAYLHAHPRSKK